MTFSIIIPIFNAEKTIFTTLESCKHQTYKEWEIILINDYSTDHSVTLINEYINMNPELPILFLSNDENKGPSYSRNKGWDSAHGDYIAFLDADDRWHPQKLEIMLTCVQQHKIKIIGHSSNIEHLSTNDWGEYIDAFHPQKVSFFSLLLRNFAVTPSIILSKDISERFRESMKYTEDHELWLRLAHHNDVYFLDIPLVTLGRVPQQVGGLSNNKLKMRLGEVMMYFYASHYSNIVLILLPILILFSLSKHLYRSIKNIRFTK